MIDLSFIVTPPEKQAEGALLVIGFKLPPDQQEQIIYWSQQISKSEPVRYQLDHQSYLPYIRCYEIVVPQKNINLVYQKISEQCQIMIPFDFHWAEVEEEPNRVTVWGNINPVLETFHQSILYSVNYLREGYYKFKYSQQEKLNLPDQRQSLAKWGWPWVTDYRPYVVVAQSDHHIHAADFDLEWAYSKCHIQEMLVAQKTQPGKLDNITYYPLAGTPSSSAA